MPASDDVRIGDFSRPVVDPAGASPTKARLDAAEQRLEAEVTRDEALLKPKLAFEDALKEVGLTRDRAAAIVDAVLLKGTWSEEVKITSRIKARFRTRNARDTKRAQEILEAQRFTIDAHYSETLTRLLLAASLEQFGDEQLPHPPLRKTSEAEIEKAFQERIAYVDALPDPALRVLFRKLFEFDQRITVALAEGSIENF